MLRRIFLCLTLIAAQPLLAQTTAPVIHTAAELQQREARLMRSAKASPTGLALDNMDEFGTYHTMLIVRVHTGSAERHQFWADQMIVEKGTITLVTGGTMQAERTNDNRPGETLGSGIQGGKEVILHPGDIAHIPANVPHLVKIAPGTTTTYLVFKEK
jgi:mannose-6-phosphate isomerase-like protein (cupin superfamily)